MLFRRKTTAEKIKKQYQKLAEKKHYMPICQDPDFGKEK